MKNYKNRLAVIAVALGYFVDLYDLMLFSSVRVASLHELGFTAEQSTDYAKTLMSCTVWGMLFGGLFWGLFSDRFGRLSILFYSILTYTLCNFVNAFVPNIEVYMICRFFAGFGIAGELGVGITLISENLSQKKRDGSTAIITAIGMFGAVTAGALAYLLKGQLVWGLSSWRVLFVLGGIFGVCLLLFRMSIAESTLFLEKREHRPWIQNAQLLFSRKYLLLKFLKCIGTGLPVFIIIGIFITLAAEFGKADGLTQIEPSIAVMVTYFTIGVFDYLGLMLSRYLQSRKTVLLMFLTVQLVSILVFLYTPTPSPFIFYLKCAFLGMGIGYWGLMVLNSAEQFGTDMRGTVTTWVPNVVRWALVPMSWVIFDPLKPHFGLVNSAATVALIAVAIAIFCVYHLEERFGREAAFTEIGAPAAEKPISSAVLAIG